MRLFKPEGVYPAMLTPFDANGRINEPVVRDLVEFFIEKKVSGLFPVSSVGEFAHMTLDQRKQLIDIVADQAKGRVPVTPGAGATHPAHVIEVARHAQKAGCAAVVVCGPYYYQVTQGMVERYFEAILEAVDIPVILYNIPAFSNEISPTTISSLCSREKVVGIKDSSANMTNMTHVIDFVQNTKVEFNVLTGSEQIFYPFLCAGGKGSMTGSASVVPELMVKIYDAFKAGDHEKAKKVQYLLLPLLRLMLTVPFPVGFKAALETRGFPMGPFIQPLTEAEEVHYHEVKPRLKDMIDHIEKELSLL
jgi:4-hydroxy-tetrahydrodipicolinate synthase